MRRPYAIVLMIALATSIVVNIVLAFLLVQNLNEATSYEGTWKCSTNPLYEITMYVDHHGTFYQAVSVEDKMVQVTKGHIEGNTLVYQGIHEISTGDHYEYLSDIPDEMYKEANYFYVIERTSKNTLTLKTSDGGGTKDDFVRVEE